MHISLSSPELLIFVIFNVVQVDPSRDAGDDKKSRVTRKHVIIAVTCAVVTAMVIAGVLLGVKFSLDSTNEIVKVTFTLSLTERWI